MRDLRAHCANCSVRNLCLPVGVDGEGLRRIEALVVERRRLQRGETVYRAGDSFVALYALRVGSSKTTVLAEKGYEQVAGLHITGDFIGLDGIGTGRHSSDATALEETELCVLPFGELEKLARQVTQLQHNLHRILSREIERDESLLLVVGGAVLLPAGDARQVSAVGMNRVARFRLDPTPPPGAAILAVWHHPVRSVLRKFQTPSYGVTP